MLCLWRKSLLENLHILAQSLGSALPRYLGMCAVCITRRRHHRFSCTCPSPGLMHDSHGHFGRDIQGRIDRALDGMDRKDINERRREDLDKFLTTTNTKAAVFRDIIIESGVAWRSLTQVFPPYRLGLLGTHPSCKACFLLVLVLLVPAPSFCLCSQRIELLIGG